MPDPRAQRLKARCCSGPSDGPALHTRCPGAADAAAGPTTSCPPNRRARRLPARTAPIPPKPPPAPSCSRTAPNQRCIRLAAALLITCGQAQLIMLLAALHLPLFEHHTITTFRHTIHSPILFPGPQLPSTILWHPVPAFRSRNDAFGDTQNPCSTRPCAILSFAPLRPRHAGLVQCEARRLPGHRLLSTRSSTPRNSYTFFHA